MKYTRTLRLCLTAIFLLLLNSLQAQVSKEASSTRTIGNSGPGNEYELNAEFPDGSFNAYAIFAFTFSQADFGGNTVTGLSTTVLDLTIFDRSFSVAGDFNVYFTTDSAADLTSSADYDALAFDDTTTHGIDGTDFSYAPVLVGTGSYPYTGAEGGGEIVEVTLDFSAVEADLLAAINAGESFNLLIAAESGSGAQATFSGIGNNSHPGPPQLTIASDVATPEPSNYPTGFSADAVGTSIDLSWTDATGTTEPLGYYILANTSGSFTAPSDGTVYSEDSDLSDGTAAIYVDQAVETTQFSGLADTTQYFFTIYPYTNLSTSTDYKTDATPPTANATTGETPVAKTEAVIITQYYEGDSGNNKYLELTNVSESSVDMTGWTLVRYNNENAENYKTATSLPATDYADLSSLGLLSPGQVVLLANGDATTPMPAEEADLAIFYEEGFGSALSHNGNDSLALYTSTTINPATLSDVIPFTDVGNEGANTSFVRLTTDPGYTLDTGTSTSALDYPSVWQEVELATVNTATIGQDAYLGSSDLGTAPPSVVFDASSFSVDEEDGTFSIDVLILNPDGNAVSVDVAFVSGSSTADTSDIDNYTTQTVSFTVGASHLDSQTVTVTLTDDEAEEETEEAVFTLENLVTSGATAIGSPSTLSVSIIDNDTFVPDLFISEIAIPSGNASAKFVELYNASDSAVDLSAGNWYLSIFYNGASSATTNIALTGTVAAGETYVIAANESGFTTAYPSASAPDQTGNINANGNDAFGLYRGGSSSTGILTDVYGVIGVDGNSEDWNYASSQVTRNGTVLEPIDVFNIDEWTIVSSAGVEVMTPGEHTAAPPQPEPTNQATDFAAALAASDSIDLSWTDATGATLPSGYLILANTTGSFTDPVDGSAQSDDSNLADGSAVLNVAFGVEEAQFDGLSLDTTYYFKIFAYTNSGSAIDYLTTGAPTADETTPPPQPDILLTVESPASDEVLEGGTTTVTVTLSDPAPSGGLTVSLSSDDSSELTVPASVSFAEGEDTTTFTATAVADGVFDADAVVTVTGSGTGYNFGTVAITVINVQAFEAPLLITQYYDGDFTEAAPPFVPDPVIDNHIEITNVSSEELVLDADWTLTLWQGSNRDNWKSGGTASATFSLDGITIPAGESIVIENPYAAEPSYLPGTYQSGTVTDFDGDDSVVLFGPGGSGQVVYDALSFASGGDTDMKTLVRISRDKGFDTLSGTTSAGDYPDVWDVTSYTIANVNSASSGANERLGVFAPPALAEPAEQATGLLATVNGADAITVTWTDGGGDPSATGYLLLASTADSFTVPVDGTPVADDSDFGDGSAAFNIGAGSEGLALSSLTPGTTYYFQLYAYTNSGVDIDFKTDTVPAVNATTDALDSVESWLAGFGLTTAHLDDDDDDDGLAVLLEYYGDTDPDEPSVLTLAIELNGSDQLVLVVTSTRATEPDAVDIQLIGTDTLLSDDWENVTFTYAVVDNLDGTFDHRYTQTATFDGGGLPFISLQVNYAP